MAIYLGLDKVSMVGGQPVIGSAPDDFVYAVTGISGAMSGFILNDNEYYESTNQGVDSSYSICRIHFIVYKNCTVNFEVINYAENNYDYAMFSNLNTSLSLAASDDGASGSAKVYKSFKGLSASGTQSFTYDLTAGEHFIDVKFKKDGSQHNNNDSVQFKITNGRNMGTDPNPGVSTMDASVTSADIAEGAVVYSRGQRIVGDVQTYDNGTSYWPEVNAVSAYGTASNGVMYTQVNVPQNTLMRAGSNVWAQVPLNLMGNATAADVVAGKTFTSTNGVNVTGTYTASAPSYVTQATPTISLNTSTGVITANASQSAGYVNAGTKTNTFSLTTQGATTITPKNTSQTAVAANRYTTGTVTVAGDANLTAANIKSGVKIFNITGTATGGLAANTIVYGSYSNKTLFTGYSGMTGIGGGGSGVQAQYGSSVTSSGGEVSIVSPTSLTINSVATANTLLGKYVKVNDSTYGGGSRGVLHIPSGATMSYSGGSMSTTVSASNAAYVFCYNKTY